MKFVVVRLGKNSIADILHLNDPITLGAVPFPLLFTCTQVQSAISEGDYVILWLGSDNHKGQPTSWKRGVRGVGRIDHLSRGAGHNDTSNIKMEVIAVFPESIDQHDFLERNASLYRFFSKYPVVGVNSSRNNAIQLVNEGEKVNTSALLTAICIRFPEVRKQLDENAPELGHLLSFAPTSGSSEPKKVPTKIPDTDLVWKWASGEIHDKNERNLLFVGPPGTGKTWYAREVASKLVGGDVSRYLLVQFHPSFSYDDFVEGYTPRTSDGSSTVEYRLEPKHFLRLCDEAEKDEDNLYVIVIDELTRGDPSRIFGELLTYIEAEHRGTQFSLAYSGEPARVPKNVVVIATANPYDKSVGELDEALVRRFVLRDFYPDGEALGRRLRDLGGTEEFASRVLHAFAIINDVAPDGFGHSHFWNVRTEDDFRTLWKSRVLFLLRRALLFDEENFDNLREQVEGVFPDPKT